MNWTGLSASNHVLPPVGSPMGSCSQIRSDGWPSDHSWRPATLCITPHQHPYETCILLLSVHVTGSHKIFLLYPTSTMWSFLTRNSCSSPLALEQQYRKWLVMSGTHSFRASLPFLSTTWKKYPKNVILYRMLVISTLASQYFVIKYLYWLFSLSSQPFFGWWFGASWATSHYEKQFWLKSMTHGVSPLQISWRMVKMISLSLGHLVYTYCI